MLEDKETGETRTEDQEVDVGYFQVYLDAFRELSSCRLNGMGLGPIPFTAVVEYFSIYPIGDIFEDFHYIIRSLDDVLMENEAAKIKKASAVKDAKDKPGESTSANAERNSRDTSR